MDAYGLQPKFDVKEDPVYSNIKLIAKKAQEHNKIAGIHNGTIKYAKEMIDLGYKFVKDNNIGMDSKEMGKRFMNSMDTAFEKWKKPKPFQIYNTERKVIKKNPGILEGKRSYLWQDR